MKNVKASKEHKGWRTGSEIENMNPRNKRQDSEKEEKEDIRNGSRKRGRLGKMDNTRRKRNHEPWQKQQE